MEVEGVVFVSVMESVENDHNATDLSRLKAAISCTDADYLATVFCTFTVAHVCVYDPCTHARCAQVRHQQLLELLGNQQPPTTRVWPHPVRPDRAETHMKT